MLPDTTTPFHSFASNNMKLISWLLLAGVAACQSPSSETTTAQTTAPPVQVAAKQPATQASPAFVFDVPVLLGQSLGQIEQQLGKPKSADTPNASADELERTYTKQDQKLIITYNTKTKQLESFFLPAPGPTETTKNCNKLLVAGRLRPSSPTYIVDSLAGAEAGEYLGIVVTKK